MSPKDSRSSTASSSATAHTALQKLPAEVSRLSSSRKAQPEPPIPKKPARTTFQAVKGKYRKPGTGCVTQISDHLWEGRYSPKVNGKRMARNIYAQTEAECEEKLAQMIREMKMEIANLRTQAKAG